MIFVRNRLVNPNELIKNYNKEEIEIRNKAVGGSTKIGFMNINGIPSGNKNLLKYRVLENFMKPNDINVFLETGCTDK